MKRLLVGLVLGLLLLFAISRQVDVGAVAAAFSAASSPLLGASILAVFVELWLKARRWSAAIAAATGERPRKRLFASMLIGTAGNVALPARVGDVLRAFVLRKHNGVDVAQSLTASWSVQVLDFLVVALLLFFLAPTQSFASSAALGGIAAAALGILVVLAAVRRFPKLLGLVRNLPPWARRRLEPLTASAREGLAFLDSLPAIGIVAGLTLAIWITEAIAITSALRAFALAPPLEAGPLLAAAIGLSFVLPLTPGNLGTIQLVSIFVLGAFGIARESAFAFGLGYQALTQLLVLVVGFAALQREGLDWRALPEARPL